MHGYVFFEGRIVVHVIVVEDEMSDLEDVELEDIAVQLAASSFQRVDTAEIYEHAGDVLSGYGYGVP